VTPGRILVLHDRPDEVLPTLRAGFPHAMFHVAHRPEDVAPALASFRPDTVFSIKHSGFPGPAHRPAVEFPTVRWFHVGGSGYEHLGRWDPSAVTVTNSAGVLAPFLAERALGALLALTTGLVHHIDQQRRAHWSPTRFRSLQGRTAVLIGMGHTGTAFARLLRPLGLHVVGVRREPVPHPDVHEVVPLAALDDLLPRADILSLHVRLTDTTRGLLDARRLARLPPGAIVLNAARGPVLDASALAAHLTAGRLDGAWLDVFETEPLPSDSPLWRTPGLLVTPHCADQVDDFPARFAARFVALARDLQAGVSLPALVPPPEPER
jgi:phosphoglycerate dehydrogenase-like enzyme